MMKLKKLLRTSVISVLLVCMLTGLMPAFHTEADAAWENGKQIVLTEEQIKKAVDWAKYTLNSDRKKDYNHDNETWCDSFVQDCYTKGAGLQNYNTAAGNARARGLVAKAAGRLHTDMDPPVGAIVYWEWGKFVTRDKKGTNGVKEDINFGHCGICIGNRKVINVRKAANGYMSTNTMDIECP